MRIFFSSSAVMTEMHMTFLRGHKKEEIESSNPALTSGYPLEIATILFSASRSVGPKLFDEISIIKTASLISSKKEKFALRADPAVYPFLVLK